MTLEQHWRKTNEPNRAINDDVVRSVAMLFNEFIYREHT